MPQDNRSAIDLVTEDLDLRGFEVAALICTKGDEAYILRYDSKGLLQYISRGIKGPLAFSERLQGRMTRPIVDMAFAGGDS